MSDAEDNSNSEYQCSEDEDSEDEGFVVEETYEDWLSKNQAHAAQVWMNVKLRLLYCTNLGTREQEELAKDAFLEWYYEHVVCLDM